MISFLIFGKRRTNRRTDMICFLILGKRRTDMISILIFGKRRNKQKNRHDIFSDPWEKKNKQKKTISSTSVHRFSPYISF
jgi:hypothetical protein